jgi:hypothetical protein
MSTRRYLPIRQSQAKGVRSRPRRSGGYPMIRRANSQSPPRPHPVVSGACSHSGEHVLLWDPGATPQFGTPAIKI